MTVPTALPTSPSQERVLDLRWAIYSSGSESDEEYEVWGVSGKIDETVRAEIADVCGEFHPYDDSPGETICYLFWETQSTHEWALTRIAPDQYMKSLGLRRAYHYLTILFNDDDIRTVGGNITAWMGSQFGDRFWEMLRKLAHDGNFEEQEIALKGITQPAPGKKEDLPQVGAVLTNDAENLRRLKSRINQAAEEMRQEWGRGDSTPVRLPTFTTWWSSTAPLPKQRYDIIIQASKQRAPSARDLQEPIRAATVRLQTELPILPREEEDGRALLEDIRKASDSLSNEFTTTFNNKDTFAEDAWKKKMGELAATATTTEDKIKILVERRELNLSRTKRLILREVGKDFARLGKQIKTLPHPNPFINQTPTSRLVEDVPISHPLPEKPATPLALLIVGSILKGLLRGLQWFIGFPWKFPARQTNEETKLYGLRVVLGILIGVLLRFSVLVGPPALAGVLYPPLKPTLARVPVLGVMFREPKKEKPKDKAPIKVDTTPRLSNEDILKIKYQAYVLAKDMTVARIKGKPYRLSTGEVVKSGQPYKHPNGKIRVEGERALADKIIPLSVEKAYSVVTGKTVRFATLKKLYPDLATGAGEGISRGILDFEAELATATPPPATPPPATPPPATPPPATPPPPVIDMPPTAQTRKPSQNRKPQSRKPQSRKPHSHKPKGNQSSSPKPQSQKPQSNKPSIKPAGDNTPKVRTTGGGSDG